MLRTVMDLPGDSFEERWSALERRVRDSCQDAEAPYPQRTLKAAKPWLRTIGMWFDWAGPLMGNIGPLAEGSLEWALEEHESVGRQGNPAGAGLVLPPFTDEDPVLCLLREVDHLVLRYGEDQPADHSEFPGARRHLFSIIEYVNRCLLSVGGPSPKELNRVSPLKDEANNPLRLVVLRHTGGGAPTGRKRYHPRFRQQAVLAVADYLRRTGDVMPEKQRSSAKSALQKRAEKRNEDPEDVLNAAVAKAVPCAYRRMRDNLEFEVKGLAHAPMRFVADAPTVAAVPIDAPPRAVEMLKDRAVYRMLRVSLRPGVESSKLRDALRTQLREDLLSPRDRDRDRDRRTFKPLKANESRPVRPEVVESVRLRSRQTISHEQEIEARLQIEEFLSCGALSDREREVFQLRYNQGLRAADIADRLDLSPSTVRTYFRRARDKYWQSTG